MPVHVDQPGHERAPATLDEHGGGASIGRDRTCGNTFDLVPAHQNVSRRSKGAALAVKNPDVLK
jgi:hypothetical protein